MYETLTYEADGHVRLVGLNRPAKRNAFTVKMLHELADAYRRYEDDADARCLVLHAHGEHFTGGLDLAEVGPHVANGGGLSDENGIDPMDVFGRRRTKPVVMAIRGLCFTIGIELALASDIRIAASDARFNQLEVGRGILPFGGATLRFAQVAGWGDAMRWILTGDFFDAAEAHRIGLVQQVVAPGEELAVATKIAQTVAAQAPLAVKAALAASKRTVERGFEAGREGLLEEARALMKTEDSAEGVKSFVERRKAVFVGR